MSAALTHVHTTAPIVTVECVTRVVAIEHRWSRRAWLEPLWHWLGRLMDVQTVVHLRSRVFVNSVLVEADVYARLPPGRVLYRTAEFASPATAVCCAGNYLKGCAETSERHRKTLCVN